MLKIGKLLILASYILVILLINYFKGAKICWFFAQLYKNSTDCFVLEVLTINNTMSRFQNRFCIIEIQQNENKILYLASEMGATTVDSR